LTKKGAQRTESAIDFVDFSSINKIILEETADCHASYNKKSGWLIATPIPSKNQISKIKN